MTTIKFDASTTKAIDQYIKTNFPDVENINTASRTGVALALWAEKSQSVKLKKYDKKLSVIAGQLGLSKGKYSAYRKKQEGVFRYYNVDSRHVRLIPKMAVFTGKLSMVRVTLPKTKGVDFQTDIGSVLQRDHLYRSIKEFKKTYPEKPYNQTTRLDLITPPREHGVRFGAISVYLGYTKKSKKPSFYVLEAGTAIGEPKVPFVCDEIGGQIIAFSDYKPTPFANKSNIYVGTLTGAGDSPKVMSMTSRRNNQKPYIEVKATFKETKKPRNIWPGFLITAAAMLVMKRRKKVMPTLPKK